MAVSYIVIDNIEDYVQYDVMAKENKKVHPDLHSTRSLIGGTAGLEYIAFHRKLLQARQRKPHKSEPWRRIHWPSQDWLSQ